MLLIGIIGPRSGLTGFARPVQSSGWMAFALRRSWQGGGICRARNVVPWRCFAQAARAAVSRNERRRRAKEAASGGEKRLEIPERLIIYHAGMGRVAFLAMVKLTSLLLGAFFGLLVVPSYVMAEKPVAQTAAVAAAGMVPILFIAYTTAPFVTHIHVHLPPGARTSRAVLERFVGAMPASSRLTFTTMSLIAKPRYSSVAVGDLRVVRGRRFGLVNYVRDTKAENATRKWYMYRAVGGFHVQEGRVEGKRYGRKAKVDGWIWDAVREKVGGEGR
ncbi:hypothetical protein E4U42_001835 [Claviceps africana]|uniref:Uncharacterized protein n=1 Tax=Claviceps africana TaxID=83212 RepID=A0A8K0J940_9HYPO|nr:hypothetical protein E4U42_001835 [Claviceps africana]